MNVANLRSPFHKASESGLEAKIVAFFMQKWLDGIKNEIKLQINYILKKKSSSTLEKTSQSIKIFAVTYNVFQIEAYNC